MNESDLFLPVVDSCETGGDSDGNLSARPTGEGRREKKGYQQVSERVEGND